MRVRFSNEGIQIDVKSNSMANFVFGGVATKSDTRKMKSALEAKLRKMRGEDTSRSDSRHTKYKTDNICKAQEQLSKLKYDPGPADGIMGSKTKNAIMSFQRDNNLIVSGELDESTIKKLNEVGHMTVNANER
jgi:peptidoglycan hydrolase-like protein with peptidoglycan-binding domain